MDCETGSTNTAGSDIRVVAPNVLHVFNAHIDMLNHTPVEHARWNLPSTVFPLKFVETPQHDSFPLGESISTICKMKRCVTKALIPKASPNNASLPA